MWLTYVVCGWIHHGSIKYLFQGILQLSIIFNFDIFTQGWIDCVNFILISTKHWTTIHKKLIQSLLNAIHRVALYSSHTLCIPGLSWVFKISLGMYTLVHIFLSRRMTHSLGWDSSISNPMGRFINFPTWPQIYCSIVNIPQNWCEAIWECSELEWPLQTSIWPLDIRSSNNLLPIVV